MKNKQQPLFHEVYNSYYEAVQQMILKARAGELNRQSVEEIAEERAFSESFIYIQEAIATEEWKVITRDFKTPVRDLTKRPLTLLEKQWLAAVKLDPRMKLFQEGEEPEQDQNVTPLYRQEDFYMVDRVGDPDPYESIAYREVFRSIQEALKQKKPLTVDYINGKGRQRRLRLMPYRLEYSEKDDKFRLLGKWERKSLILNLSRMKACRMEEDAQAAGTPVSLPKLKKKSVILELVDRRKALERFMIHFADLEKITSCLSEEEGRYRVKLAYRREDETEILIRILAFGPFVKVEAPLSFQTLVRDRLKRQMEIR